MTRTWPQRAAARGIVTGPGPDTIWRLGRRRANLGPVVRIVIAAVQVPFERGGAEWHVDALHKELLAQGHQSEIVQLPFQWSPREAALRSALAWRLLDLTESNGVPVDLVIGTRFPSYAVRHPRKVLWLFHQFRQAYDLHDAGVDGFPDTPAGRELRQHFIALDTRLLHECRRIFTTSQNNAGRLARYNGVTAEVLRLPLLDHSSWRSEAWEDYVLSVGRLDRLKRTDLLIRAATELGGAARVVIVGRGPLEAELRQLAVDLGVADRIDFRGHVDDAELRRLYARCAAVYYAPFDEDYGLVTLEAFHSRKPVVTTVDAGGPLEFVRDGETGLVASVDPRAIGSGLARLLADKALAASLGERGYAAVQHIQWPEVIAKLTAPG